LRVFRWMGLGTLGSSVLAALQGCSPGEFLLALLLMFGVSGGEPAGGGEDPLPKMYWTDTGTDKIQRANVDGTDVEDLVTAADGLDDPRGLALDLDAGKMYWVDIGTDKIQRANLDGSNVEDLVTSADGVFPGPGIVLDLTADKVYWTDPGAQEIQRADLDGSNVETVFGVSGLPAFVALDLEAGKVYWGDPFGQEIRRADLDGSNDELVTEDPFYGNDGGDIDLDLTADKVYWTDAEGEFVEQNYERGKTWRIPEWLGQVTRSR